MNSRKELIVHPFIIKYDRKEWFPEELPIDVVEELFTILIDILIAHDNQDPGLYDGGKL